MLSKNDIFPIGIGTWKIDYENINNEIESLRYSYEKGQNYLSLYRMYNGGSVVKVLKGYISLIDTCIEMKRLVDIGKVRYLGISKKT
ncbi:MAG: hypothetical protein ACLU84_03605 [Clostridia bacterium]